MISYKVNKKILFISYLFPPIGGGGTQRVVKFIKFLPRLGWSPDVLTVKNDYSFPEDKSLFTDIPPETKIHRAATLSPVAYFSGNNLIKRLLRIMLNIILLPSIDILWLPLAYIKIINIVEKGKPNIIISSSSPYTNHLLALIIKKRLNIPWVADFRDEWSQNPFIKQPTKIHKKITNWLEKRILMNADYVISVSSIITKKLSNLLPAKYENKFTTITNGFDQDDFDSKEFGKRSSINQLTVTYCGSLYGKQIPYPFFSALVELIKSKTINSKKVQLIFVGNAPLKIRQQIPEPLVSSVKFYGYQPHKQVLSFLSAADILLLYIDPLRGEGTYTGKLFEYMASGKIIFAIVPPKGLAAGLVMQTKTGLIADPNNPNDIKDKFYNLYKNWISKSLSILPDHKMINQYSRLELTKQLVTILNRLA